jgi:hypothetical protein
MRRTPSPAAVLAERLCRPQRIGVFGHRGVGKTTLLTMLYREGVGGRLADLRLAAADARTANYLSDKVLLLESGQPLPATLAETDLRFHLYHRTARLELLVKDYQGEHVELGRVEPIGDFLRDCDAVWLCLDAATVTAAADRLRRQQEVEQLVEQILAVEPLRTMDRPMALVLTKADLLAEGTDLPALAGTHFDMVRHALRSHCPHNGLFAVSSLGKVDGDPKSLRPAGLAEPLAWLAAALQAQDEARLAQLWALAQRQPALLERGVACFARRYPGAPATAEYRRRVRELRWRLLRRRALAALGTAAALAAGLWSYDALAYQQAERFEQRDGADPAAVLQNWHGYQAWHPTRNLLRSGAAAAEAEHLQALGQEVRRHDCERSLAELRRRSGDPDADPERLWREFQAFHASYPEADVEGELQSLRGTLQARRDAQRTERAQRAFDELVDGEQQAPDLLTLVGEADRFLRDYDGTPHADEVRHRRAAYLARLDDRDIEFARSYSARQPLNFQTRRETYQHYLDRHPTGSSADEARAAVQAIEVEWDRYDFRALRDQFVAHPGDIPELVARCRTYLAVHPQGKFRASAEELLRWSEKVTAPQEYRVVLRSGDFDHKVARYFSRGPDLTVEVEVAGARYGPSPSTPRRYDPEWNYEFPRRIRWKLGDPVRIRVTDLTWSPRVVAEFASEDGDPLALKMLTGDVWSGPNRLTFECDFALPTLPNIE